MTKLPPEYESALVGHTIDPIGPPKWVYCLESLTDLVVGAAAAAGQTISREAGRGRVLDLLRGIAADYGDRIPVFVNLGEKEEKKGPKIWTPGG